MAIEVKTKKWGNSLGIGLPASLVEKLRIKPEEKITIEITHKENPLREMFGKAKTKISAKEAILEFRKNTSKWMD